MSNAISRSATITVLLSVSVATATLAQAPTDAQRAAIKSQCRSDYMAHCASIPPGGAASLQCLQKNMASLAPGCQTAVRAVAAPSEAKSETKPEPAAAPAAAPATETKAEPAPAPAAKTATEPAAAPAAKTTSPKPATANTTAAKPSSAQVAAIRSACRSDYPKVCASVPPGGAAALQCLEKSRARLSSACQTALAAASGGGAPPAAAAKADAAPARATAAAPAAPTVMALRPMRPREVLFVMRSACGADVRAYCAGVDPGGGRVAECLGRNAASLSPACRGVLSRFVAR